MHLRRLVLGTEKPEDSDGQLERSNKPQTVLHSPGSLGDKTSCDSADEGEGEGDGTLVPLGVLAEGGEYFGIADEIAQQRCDDDGRHLRDAQAAAVHDLASRLEGQQRDGRELREVDVGWVAPRWVPPIDQPALDYTRRQRHEDGLRQERDEDGPPLTSLSDQRVEPREADAAYYKKPDGCHCIKKRL